MNKYLSRVLLALVTTVLMLGSTGTLPVSAQDGSNEPLTLKNVHVWVNPEYDDPRLLVMLQGQIEGPKSPVEVKFLVPTAAEMYSAGSMDPQGKYSGGPPARKGSSVPDWDEISFKVTTDTFRVEYYDPVISKKPDKSFSYQFLRLYRISNLTVIIQEPRKSSNFTLSPIGDAAVDTEGFDTHVYSFSNLDDKTPVQFQVSYTRTETEPSLSGQSASSGSASPSLTGGALIGVAALVVAGLVLAMISRRRRTAPERKARDIRGSRGRDSQARFCTQCGKGLAGQDRFCPNCGARLRQ